MLQQGQRPPQLFWAVSSAEAPGQTCRVRVTGKEGPREGGGEQCLIHRESQSRRNGSDLHQLPAKTPVRFSELPPSDPQVVPTRPPPGTRNTSHLLPNLQPPPLVMAPCATSLHLLPTASQRAHTGRTHDRPPQARWVRCAPRNQCRQRLFFPLSVLKTHL